MFDHHLIVREDLKTLIRENLERNRLLCSFAAPHGLSLKGEQSYLILKLLALGRDESTNQGDGFIVDSRLCVDDVLLKERRFFEADFVEVGVKGARPTDLNTVTARLPSGRK